MCGGRSARSWILRAVTVVCGVRVKHGYTRRGVSIGSGTTLIAAAREPQATAVSVELMVQLMCAKLLVYCGTGALLYAVMSMLFKIRMPKRRERYVGRHRL